MQLNKNSGLNVYIYFYFLPPHPKYIHIYEKNNFIQFKTTWIEKWEGERNNNFLETGNNFLGRPTRTHS